MTPGPAKSRPHPRPVTAGLAARKRALEIVVAVLDQGEPLEYILDRDGAKAVAGKSVAPMGKGKGAQHRSPANIPSGPNHLPANDRALARAIAATTLRRRGQIDQILARSMEKPLGKRGGIALHILRVAVAQILFMDVPDHASVSLAMELAKADGKARHFSKLVNGVLRGIARDRAALLGDLDPLDNLPDWLRQRWSAAYGEAITRQMAGSLLNEPYLDIRLKQGATHSFDPAMVHAVLPNGSLRLRGRGLVSDLAGYNEGIWWVQDMAASLAPVLFGNVAGKRIADLCAAPGGKTAFLADAGARVTAVDVSRERLGKLQENLNRLHLKAEIVLSDIADFVPDALFDGVLLDAPCSATGTVRRHPDILALKTPEVIERMAKVQRQMLRRAVDMLAPGGILVYCTCSLEPEEGEAVLDFIRQENLPLTVVPVEGAEVGGLTAILRPDGTIRTRPDHDPLTPEADMPNVDPAPAVSPMSGIDGFFIARFRKRG